MEKEKYDLNSAISKDIEVWFNDGTIPSRYVSGTLEGTDDQFIFVKSKKEGIVGISKKEIKRFIIGSVKR